MKASELRDLSDGKLREQIATARRDLFGLRMQSATGELDNTARLSGAKRDSRAGTHRRPPARRRPQREREHDD